MTAVEFFGDGRRPESRDARESFLLDRFASSMASEAERSLAAFLGVPVPEVLALRDADLLGQAIEARTAERSAEKRALCTCGCQDTGADPLALNAMLRRKYRP